MSTVLSLLGLACSLGAFVCHVLLLIHAFKKSTTEGLLTLCVPCYGIYYAFTKFEHENKNLIIALYLGGGFASGVFRGLAQAMQ